MKQSLLFIGPSVTVRKSTQAFDHELIFWSAIETENFKGKNKLSALFWV